MSKADRRAKKRKKVGRKIKNAKQRRRTQGKKQIEVRKSNAEKYAENSLGKTNEEDLPIYGIVKTGNKWALTCYSASRYSYTTSGCGRSQTRRKQTHTSCYMTNENPAEGLPLKEFDTKKDAMEYVGADTTEQYEKGAYMVKKRELSGYSKSFEVPKDDWQAFWTKSVSV